MKKKTQMWQTDSVYRDRSDVEQLQKRVEDARVALFGARRKLCAWRKLAERKAEFAKYDIDGDGKLNRQELSAFSLAQYKFEVPEDVLAKVIKHLDPVVFEKFRAVRAMVAIARSESVVREQRARDLAKRQSYDFAKAEMQQRIDDALDV